MNSQLAQCVRCRLWLTVCVVGFSYLNVTYGSTEESAELSPELTARYEVLIAELRCPKCLNINIADSNAPIAQDLRQVVVRQLQEGKSNADIKSFLRSKYGDFIDYNPPLTLDTVALWVIPIAVFLCAVCVFAYLGRRRVAISLSNQEKARIQAIKADRSP